MPTLTIGAILRHLSRVIHYGELRNNFRQSVSRRDKIVYDTATPHVVGYLLSRSHGVLRLQRRNSWNGMDAYCSVLYRLDAIFLAEQYDFNICAFMSSTSMYIASSVMFKDVRRNNEHGGTMNYNAWKETCVDRNKQNNFNRMNLSVLPLGGNKGEHTARSMLCSDTGPLVHGALEHSFN